MAETARMYLYLARRDRKGVRVLAVFDGAPTTSRVTDLRVLGLDHVTAGRVGDLVYESRMLWEPWVEPAASYKELQSRLAARGFTGLPLAGTPVLDLGAGRVLDTSRLPGRKVMTRRQV